MDHPFEDIEVKENALKLLEEALKRKRRPCMIGTGAMSDPYMPLEEELQMTRGMLELVDRYGFGVTLLTKSDRVLRDLDLLRSIHGKTKAVVQMTLTTMDEDLCRILEPNVAVTRRRLEVLKRLQEAGIPTVVWLCPLIPFLNDTPENIAAIVNACAQAGVKGIIHFGMGLTLREGNREYFYRALDRHFPGLSQRYVRTYGNAYSLPSPREQELEQVFQSLCREYGIWQDNRQIFSYLHTFEESGAGSQMSFFG